MRRCKIVHLKQKYPQPGIRIHKLLEDIHDSIEAGVMPEDVRVDWLWYDPPLCCYCAILFSETWDEVPDDEIPPVIKLEVPLEECPKCQKPVPEGSVYTRYSFGVYAGKFCDDCAYGYRDHCGMDGRQGTQAEIDEIIEPEDYY